MPSPQSYYRAALICGLAPLAIGTGIFLLWCVTTWDGICFFFAGVLTILVGLISVLTGIRALISYACCALRTERKSAVVGRVLAGTAALLVNFPVAMAFVEIVDKVEGSSHFTVINHGPAIDRFVITGGGVEVDFGPIASGETSMRSFYVVQDGDLHYHARRGGASLDDSFGYVTNGPGYNYVVTFAPDGSWTSDSEPSRHRRLADAWSFP